MTEMIPRGLRNFQKDEAREKLESLSDDFGDLIDRGSNNMTAAQVANNLKTHISGTLDFIDAHAAEDEAVKAQLVKTGYDQAGKFAEFLSEGMLKDNPNL